MQMAREKLRQKMRKQLIFISAMVLLRTHALMCCWWSWSKSARDPCLTQKGAVAPECPDAIPASTPLTSTSLENTGTQTQKLLCFQASYMGGWGDFSNPVQIFFQAGLDSSPSWVFSNSSRPFLLFVKFALYHFRTQFDRYPDDS